MAAAGLPTRHPRLADNALADNALADNALADNALADNALGRAPSALRTVAPMRTIRRIRAARAALADSSRSPLERARYAQLAGPTLYAEGLIGLDGVPGQRAPRLGIIATSIFLLPFASLLTLIGLIIAIGSGLDDPYEGGLVVPGVVIDQGAETVIEQPFEDEPPREVTRCAPTVSYEVAGTRYEVRSRVRSDDSCVPLGAQHPVSYLPDRPAEGRPQLSGPESPLARWPLLVFGLTLLTLALTVLALRITPIVIGIRMSRRGRAEREALPDASTRSLDAVLVDELMTTFEIDEWLRPHLVEMTRFRNPPIQTAPRRVSPDAPLPTTAVHTYTDPVPAPPLPAAPAAQPPTPTAELAPGWYPDPDGEGLRWWNGEHWTTDEHPGT